MKAVVVHSASARVELDWANQFAGAGSEAAQETAFPGPQWAVRVRRVFTIPGFAAGANRWAPIVDTVKAAATAAGSGGVVIVASGHGGAVPIEVFHRHGVKVVLEENGRVLFAFESLAARELAWREAGACGASLKEIAVYRTV